MRTDVDRLVTAMVFGALAGLTLALAFLWWMRRAA